MKKLNLEKLKLAAEDVLQRSQLAGIYGGSGGPCDLTCEHWSRSMEVADCSLSTRRFYCGGTDPEATCMCS